MPRRTKKIYGKKPIQKKRFYTKRYGGDYSENIKGLLHDVAGTLSEDIAMKTTEMIENRLNADFGEKVATKAADKVIISMAQVFQDAASKISQNPTSESPALISPDLGQIEETPTEQSYMNEPPVVDESPTEEVNSTEEVPPPTEEVPPPTEEVPPPTEEVPPLTEETPPPTEEVPPPTEEVPPPTEEVPPPTEEVPPPTEEVPPPTEEVPPPTEETPPPTEEVPREQGPPPPQMNQPAQNGEGNMNPESNEIPQIEPKKVGGKSRSSGRGKKRMSRNKRNLDRQYQSQYY